MENRKLKPCNCDMSIPFGYGTSFLGIPLYYTIICVGCRRRKVRAKTLEKCIEKWNRRAENGKS